MVNLALSSEAFRTIQHDLNIMSVSLSNKAIGDKHAELLQILTDLHLLFAREVNKKES